MSGVGGDVDALGGDAALPGDGVGIEEGAVVMSFEEAAAADRDPGQREGGGAGGAQLEAADVARVEEMSADRDREAAPGRGDGGAARHLAAADRAEEDGIEAAGDVAEAEAEFGGAAEGGVLAAENRRPLLTADAVRA